MVGFRGVSEMRFRQGDAFSLESLPPRGPEYRLSRWIGITNNASFYRHTGITMNEARNASPWVAGAHLPAGAKRLVDRDQRCRGIGAALRQQ